MSFIFDEKARFPHHPYCTDDLSAGIRPRNLLSAIKKSYIQVNPPWLRVWSIHDCDYEGAAYAWEDANLPPPTWSCINGENAHAHLVWGLRAPVLVEGMEARDAPMRYLCAVESMMREKLHADPGFSGLITKNPTHPLWKTLYNGTIYDLGELAEYLPDIEKHINRKRKPAEVGLGRNVTLFDSLRHWAYRNVRQHKGGGLSADGQAQAGLQGWNAWLSLCNCKALERNGDFNHPLDGREVWHIAKSVSKWTYKNFDVEASDARFAKLQALRGKASGKARLSANEDKRASARLMRARGMSLRDIAAELNVSKSVIGNWCQGVSSEP
ncbi:MAG: replication initiation protein [Sideroxydans sp.]|nr:replication initiation protein [Sideroxydans sp.]